MAKLGQNFEMFLGDNKNLIFTVENTETLTGVTIKWKLAKNHRSEPLIIKTDEDPEEISVNENKFTVYLKPEDTKKLDSDWNYYHEVELTDSEGNIYTVATGTGIFYPALID